MAEDVEGDEGGRGSEMARETHKGRKKKGRGKHGRKTKGRK